MALLLRPGDPLPALHLTSGRLDPKAFAGHYWAIAVGPWTALHALPMDGLRRVKGTQDALGLQAAQRLGAELRAGEPEPLVVLLDPAGTVVQSWADAPLGVLLERARQKAQDLAGN